MARSRNSYPSTKGRLQQKLKSELASGFVKPTTLKLTAADLRQGRHEWLFSHLERQHGLCAYCGIRMLRTAGRKAERRATLDHVIPLARGGRDAKDNTVAACQACNSTKGHMTAQQFRMSPFLKKRKAYVATIPNRPMPTFTVTVLRRRKT